MLSSSAKTHPSKKLKAHKSLVLPGQSSLFKSELMDDFGLNWVTWESDAPSCNCLICVHCQKYWITKTNNPKVGPCQVSYPFIRFVDENLPLETSCTPSKWKEHKVTKYHIMVIDKNGKTNTLPYQPIFHKKTTPKKTPKDPNLSETSTPSPDPDSLSLFPPAVSLSPDIVTTLPLPANTCHGAFPPYFLTPKIKLGLIYQHLYYHPIPNSTWIVKSSDHLTYQVYSSNCDTILSTLESLGSQSDET